MKHIAILGAGISGLTCAYYLKKFLKDKAAITLFEKSDRVGGWIQSAWHNGFHFEMGPHTIRSFQGGENTLSLLEELSLQSEVLFPSPDIKKRYIFNGSDLQACPTSFFQLFSNPLTKDFLKVLWRDGWAKKRSTEDESVYSFFLRHCGVSWTENLIDPITTGIYAGDISRLSLKSCFPVFNTWEQAHRSLLRGMLFCKRSKEKRSPFVNLMRAHSLYSFKNGMETLPNRLKEAVKDLVFVQREVDRVSFLRENNQVSLSFKEGGDIKVDYLISTVPMWALSDIIKDEEALANKLKKLPYTSVAMVNMGFHSAVPIPSGFGYLVPSKWKRPLLGCIFDSSVFPEQDKEAQTRLTFMMGGKHHEAVCTQTKSSQEEIAMRALETDLHILKQPDVLKVTQAHRSIPQYEVGYARWKEDVEKHVQPLNLTLAGAGISGVSINDCISHSLKIACQFKDFLL